MPANDYNPESYFTTNIRLDHMSGDTLLKITGTGASGTNIVAQGTSWDQIDDINTLCTGRGACLGFEWGAVIESAKGAAVGVYSAFINSDDRVVIRNTVEAFTVEHSAENAIVAFGFNADIVATLVGGNYEAIAQTDYTRGILYGGVSLKSQINPSTAVAFTFSPPTGLHQGILELIRQQAEGDVLATQAGTNLSELIRVVDDENFRVFLDDDGLIRFTVNHSDNLVDWAANTSGTELRQILGFTGNETTTNVGGVYHIIGTYTPRYIAWLNRPVYGLEPRIMGHRDSSLMSDGRREITHILTEKGWKLHFEVLGEAGGSPNDIDILYDFFGYVWNSSFMTIYQQVKERRLSSRTRDGYSNLNCSERDYRVGVLQQVLDDNVTEIQYQLEDASIRQRYFLELFLWNYIAP